MAPDERRLAVEVLRRDIHPAEVLLPDGKLLLDARVFVTTERVLVWKVKEGRVQQVLERPLRAGVEIPASRQSLNGGRLEVGCELDGEKELLTINQGHGCGCGSPLKALAAPVPWTVAA